MTFRVGDMVRWVGQLNGGDERDLSVWFDAHDEVKEIPAGSVAVVTGVRDKDPDYFGSMDVNFLLYGMAPGFGIGPDCGFEKLETDDV